MTAFETVDKKVGTRDDASHYQAKHPDKAKKDPIVRYTLWLAVLTGLLVFVTALSTYFLYRTDESVHETLVLGQRAFVHLEKIEIAPAAYWVAETKVDGNVTIHDTPENKGRYLRTVFAITNAGNTPAQLSIRLRCDFARKLNDPFALLDKDTPTASRYIGAKQTITIGTDTCDFRPKDSLFNERMRIEPIFVAGEILYTDLVERRRRHVTQFGHRWVVRDFGPDDQFTSMSVATEPTGVHNCADEDCPGYSQKGHS